MRQQQEQGWQTWPTVNTRDAGERARLEAQDGGSCRPWQKQHIMVVPRLDQHPQRLVSPVEFPSKAAAK